MELSSISINRKRTNHNTLSLDIPNEDHTLGNLVKEELLQDERVTFAGYRKHHPLINQIELKVQTDDTKTNDIEMSSGHTSIPIIQYAAEKIIKKIDVLLEELK